jgi:hypothetical protein
MSRRLLVLAAAVVLLATTAPAGVAAPGCRGSGEVRLGAADSGQTVTVRCGQTLVVSLQSVPYSASYTSAPRVVQTGSIKQGSVGTGQDEFLFTAVGIGGAEVTVSRLVPVALPLNVSRTTGLQWVATIKVVK